MEMEVKHSVLLDEETKDQSAQCRVSLIRAREHVCMSERKMWRFKILNENCSPLQTWLSDFHFPPLQFNHQKIIVIQCYEIK